MKYSNFTAKRRNLLFFRNGKFITCGRRATKKISDSKLIPIVSLLRNDIIETHEETVGFVFPLHGMTVPIPVKKFMERVNLKSSQYNFAIVTRGGTKCFAFNKIDKMLKRKGKFLDSYFCLNMVSNDPKFEVYDIPTDETITKLETKIQNQLDLIKEIITKKEKRRETDSKFIAPSDFALERLILFGMFIAEHVCVKDYFYSESKCNGCGTCAMVCPSQKIKIVYGKPIWQNKVQCYMCYVCLNYCPQQSVQISSKWFMKSHTEKKWKISTSLCKCTGYI